MTTFRDRGGWRVAGQALLLTGVVLGAFFDEPWPWPVVVSGVALLSAAFGLGVVSVAHLGTALTPYPEPRPSGVLVTGGVYGSVRHPMYGALMLGSIGVALLVRSPWSLGAAAVLVGFLVLKAAAEERRLANRYIGYDAYRRRVRRRFLPWVW